MWGAQIPVAFILTHEVAHGHHGWGLTVPGHAAKSLTNGPAVGIEVAQGLRSGPG